MSADESDLPDRRLNRTRTAWQAVQEQRYLAAAMVTFGDSPLDQPGNLQHVEMMSKEIASHSGDPAQFGDCAIAHGEMVGDEQTTGIAQSGVGVGT